MNIHWIRSNFSTLSRKHIDEHKITNDIAIEFVLEHRDKNKIRETYNKHTFLEERRTLLNGGMIIWIIYDIFDKKLSIMIIYLYEMVNRIF